MKVGDASHLSKLTNLTPESATLPPATVQNEPNAQAKVKDALAQKGAEIFDNVLAAAQASVPSAPAETSGTNNSIVNKFDESAQKVIQKLGQG